MPTRLQRGLRRVEAVFNVAFGPDWNPWYQLGALAFFCFWLVVVTGIYLFIFFDTSISAAYTSVQQITQAQWYAGGIMRSLHRYASGAMVVTVTLHLLREDDVERAVEALPDSVRLYETNIETLRRLGLDGWRRLFAAADA